MPGTKIIRGGGARMLTAAEFLGNTILAGWLGTYVYRHRHDKLKGAAARYYRVTKWARVAGIVAWVIDLGVHLYFGW